MKIISHSEFPIVGKRLVSRESAYTTVIQDDFTYIRTTIDDYGSNGWEWCQIKILNGKNKALLLSEEVEDWLETLYQEELKRIEREKKLNRIV